MRSQGRSVFSMGKSRARLYDRRKERTILDEAYQRSKNVLEENSAGIDRVVEALIEHEEIPGSQVVKLLGLNGNGSGNKALDQPAREGQDSADSLDTSRNGSEDQAAG